MFAMATQPAPVPTKGSRDGRGSVLFVAPGGVTLILTSIAAVYAWPRWKAPLALCDERILGATHIDWAVGLALLSGVLGFVVLVILYGRRADLRVVGVAHVAIASLLGVCVALVLSSSATYSVLTPGDPEGSNGDWPCPTKTLTHFYSVSYLYVVWGGAIALFLLLAARAFWYARRARES